MAKLSSAILGLLLVVLSACGTPETRSANVSRGDGVVESITASGSGRDGMGIGTVAGGVVGGVLGNQVGSGRGQTAATIAGAVGGAYAGHALEKNREDKRADQLTVRMDDGNYQTVADDSGSFRVGDRVRIESNGRVIHR